jgi:hypothetical protein
MDRVLTQQTGMEMLASFVTGWRARRRPMWTTRTKVGWGLLLAGAVLMALLAVRYYAFDSEAYFPRQR